MSDPARGTRTVAYDAAGRPGEIVLADGTWWRIERADSGALRSVRASDGTFVEHHETSAGHRRIVSNDTVVDATVRAGVCELAAPGGVQRWEYDRQGRLTRVRLPGWPRALRYIHRRGDLQITWEDGEELLRVYVDGTVEWRAGVWRRQSGRLTSYWEVSDTAGRPRATLARRFDLLGRCVRRHWSDGAGEVFQRDPLGRLCRWERTGRSPESIACEYDATGCTGRRTDAGVERWELDHGGRVLRIDGPSMAQARYAYDANGRRVSYASAGTHASYRYDALGQLRSVDSGPGRHRAYEYDGLGRRIAARGDGGTRFEQRDPQGRLWELSAASEGPGHAFLWLDDRPVARLDGETLAEVFLCDEQATPLAVCGVHDGELHVTPVDQPPFGAVSMVERPTLHGHFGDPATGLICFGAREYDPRTAAFLTPEPFHGGEDDPRRLAGATARAVAAMAETPASRSHAYALSQFDPVGRADPDGHASVGRAIGWGFLNIPFSLTWGWPLTAVSAFFFAPIDIYFEVIGRFIQLWRLIGDKGSERRAPGYSTFPWPNHSIFGTRFFAGSARQGQIAFSFNGFLPRVVSGGGIDADRAVTIGQVIWIRQHELDVLSRSMVVRAYDIERADAGVTALNQDGTKFSVLAVTCTNKDARRYVHVSFWTRGPGTTLIRRGAAPGSVTFSDLPDASGKKPTYLHLARPIPLDVPHPTDSDDKEKIAIAEYLFPSGGAVTQVVLDDQVAFAIRMKTGSQIQALDRLQLSFPDDAHVDPVFVLVASVDTDSESMFDRTTALLYQGFPARVLGVGGPELQDLTARRVASDPTRSSTPGWATDGSATALKREEAGEPPPGWPPDLHAHDIVLVKATTAGTAFTALGAAAPPANDIAAATVTKLTATCTIGVALDAGHGFTTAEVRVLRVKGTQVQGVVEDEAHPEQIKFVGEEPSLATDQLVVVSKIGAADRGYARVTRYENRVLTLEWLAPPLAAGAAAVAVQALEASDRDDEKATASNPSGASFDMEVPRTTAFKPGTLLLLREGDNRQIRAITKTTKVRVELGDEVVGTGPFAIEPARIDEEFSSIGSVERAKLSRFLKRAAGPQPSSYQSYPGSVISVVLARYNVRFPVLHEFYIRSDAAELQAEYRLRWRPFTHAGTEYFLLDRDLPLYPEGGKTYWYYDRDEPSSRLEVPAPFDLEVREYVASGAKREDAAGARLLGVEPETLVPEEPDYHFTHHDALVEHETHHTIQNARYGPFMGALPLQGLLADAVDFVALARDDKPPDWLHAAVPDFDKSDQGFSYWDLISIGGIMTMVWKYVLLWPLLLDEDSRKADLKLDYNELMKVMSPIWSATIRHWPRPRPGDTSPVDPGDPYSRDAGQVIAEFILRAMDLRSWTPFIGMIPTWLGDGPRNFVEQQASRASGDLYSTILSANDKFNRDTRPFLGLFGRGSQDADLTRPLGDVVRMMIFAGGRADRLFGKQSADETGWAFRYQQTFVFHDAVKIRSISGGLVHPELYAPTAAAAPTKVPILGPDGTTVVDFDSYAANGEFAPRLRALVPVPPQVNRSAGFYFAAVTPGLYHMESYDDDAGDPAKDAKTAVVNLTIEEGKVTLGGEDIAWSAPVAHPGPPPLTKNRFFTETVELKIVRQKRGLFTITSDAAAGLVTLTDTESGSKLEIGGPPAGAAPAPARIRVFRVIRKNDPAFSLYYGDSTPGLKDVRSFLDADLWFPVRDFLLQIDPLPALAPIAMKSNEKKTVSLAIALERREKFAVRLDMPAGAPRPVPTGAVPNLATRRIGDSTTVSPRGEDWEIGPLDGLIEETATYKLDVEFGTPPRTAPSSCQVTVDPVIRLTGAAPLTAKPGSPLELTIAGGAGGYSASLSPEVPGVTTPVQAGKVVVAVAAEGANVAARSVVVTVQDGAGDQGRRTITVSRP